MYLHRRDLDARLELNPAPKVARDLSEQVLVHDYSAGQLNIFVPSCASMCFAWR